MWLPFHFLVLVPIVVQRCPNRLGIGCVVSVGDSRNLSQTFLRNLVFSKAEAHLCPSENLPLARPPGGNLRVLVDRKLSPRPKCWKKLSTIERRMNDDRKFMSVARFIWDHDPIDGRRGIVGFHHVGEQYT